MLAIFSQCAWLMLRRVDPETRRNTRLVGAIFGAYCLISLLRICIDLAIPSGTNLFASRLQEVLGVVRPQPLFVALTFSLVLMVNRRLFDAFDRNLAERKLVEEALQASEEKFALAFRTSPYAIIITRLKDGRFIDVNEAFHSIAGFTREEAANSTSIELSLWVNQEDRNQVAKRLRSGQKILGEEFQFKRKNGQVITGLFSADVFLLRNEKCVLSSVADITERTRMTKALALDAEKLARSNAELERFAYVASHDLQEPLRMVASFTQLLAKRYAGKLDEKADRYIHYAVDGATRMQQMISDLLAYSRVGSKALDLRLTECETVVAASLENLRAAINESGASVTWDPLPTFMADSMQLCQLFQNLLGNAIKFKRELPPHAHISAVDGGSEWLFSVRDNGIGIDQKHAESVFQVFHRLHAREEYPGTGIGLALAKAVVERHGGKIWVDSEVGVGSNFRFTLPKHIQNGADRERTQ
jgi:PAS domain S-box-containing protein